MFLVDVGTLLIKSLSGLLRPYDGHDRSPRYGGRRDYPYGWEGPSDCLGSPLLTHPTLLRLDSRRRGHVGVSASYVQDYTSTVIEGQINIGHTVRLRNYNVEISGPQHCQVSSVSFWNIDNTVGPRLSRPYPIQYSTHTTRGLGKLSTTHPNDVILYGKG